MRTRWTDDTGAPRQVTSPVSLVVSAFASLPDITGTWTPQLLPGSRLVLIVKDIEEETVQRLWSAFLGQQAREGAAQPA